MELVAVATGPGSFTGLRIGVTTAKTFAYAIGCPALGISTMAILASRVPAEHGAVQRGGRCPAERTLCRRFCPRQRRSNPRRSLTTRIVEARPWIDALAAGAVLTGPGLAKWMRALAAGRDDDRACLVAAPGRRRGQTGVARPTAAASGATCWRLRRSISRDCGRRAMGTKTARRCRGRRGLH